MRKILICFMMFFLLPVTVHAKVHVMLDPGHGGSDNGAANYDKTVNEKDVNLKIGLALKKCLEERYDVEVSMTRDTDKKVDLEERVKMGKDCDFVISLHNNAVAEKPAYDNGCSVLVASGNAEKKIAIETQKMGACILEELEALGLENRGLLIRYATDKSKYDNGKVMDHYKIVRQGILEKVPAIIIEHAFIDKKSDFDQFLSTDKQIESLAEADAAGIARYFGLTDQDSGEKMEPVGGDEVELVSMKGDDWTDTTSVKKVYYEDNEEETEAPAETKTEETPETTDEVPETTETTEAVPEATTEMKFKEPVAQANLGGDQIESSDLDEITEEKEVSPIWFLAGGSVLLLIATLIFVIKSLNR